MITAQSSSVRQVCHKYKVQENVPVTKQKQENNEQCVKLSFIRVGKMLLPRKSKYYKVWPLCYTHLFLLVCFNAPWQFISFLNFCSQIFGLTPFGWIQSYVNTFILMGLSFFIFAFLIYAYFFTNAARAWNKGWMYICMKNSKLTILVWLNPLWLKTLPTNVQDFSLYPHRKHCLYVAECCLRK